MNKSKAKGTNWETSIVNYLISRGLQAVRLVLHGNKDHGDISVYSPRFNAHLTIEAKNEQKFDFASYVAEAEVESENAGTMAGVAWVHRPRKSSPEEGYVVMSGKTFLKLIT